MATPRSRIQSEQEEALITSLQSTPFLCRMACEVKSMSANTVVPIIFRKI